MDTPHQHRHGPGMPAFGDFCWCCREPWRTLPLGAKVPTCKCTGSDYCLTCDNCIHHCTCHPRDRRIRPGINRYLKLMGQEQKA